MDNETFLTDMDVGSKPGKRSGLGLCGLLLAVVGLTLAIARPYLAEVLDPPPQPQPPQALSEVLAEAGGKLVDRMVDRVRGRATAGQIDRILLAQPPGRPWLLYLSVAATSLGLVGSLSGMAAWIRREEPRMAGTAIAVGVLAVAWVYIVEAMIIALVICFVILVFGNIGVPS